MGFWMGADGATGAAGAVAPAAGTKTIEPLDVITQDPAPPKAVAVALTTGAVTAVEAAVAVAVAVAPAITADGCSSFATTFLAAVRASGGNRSQTRRLLTAATTGRGA